MSEEKISLNYVNGISLTSRNSSSGRDDHNLQMAPDLQTATVSNRVKIATWNVRTLYQPGKLENAKREMKRLDVNVMEMCETRWTNCGSFVSDGYTVMFSGGDKHKKGVAFLVSASVTKCIIGFWPVSVRIIVLKLKGKYFNITIIQVYAPTSDSTDEEIETFYETLDIAKKQSGSQDVRIIMGDLNAKVGEQQNDDEGIVGRFGLGERNERGERWITWCKCNKQVLMNTWFKQHPRRLWTWQHPNGHRNQIDYITINSRFRRSILSAKSYPDADCGSDHNPIVSILPVKL